MAHHDSPRPLHHEEDRADHRFVLAEHDRTRGVGKEGSQGRQRAEFTTHVMGFGRDRPQGRPAEYELAVSEANVVGQIRMSTVELADHHRTIETVDRPTQETLESGLVESLVFTDLARAIE